MEIMCLDFINTQWYNKHKPIEEPLENSKWIQEFCDKWHIEMPDFSEKTSSELIKFRDKLFKVILEICTTKSVSDANMKKINNYLSMGRSEQYISLEGDILKLNTVSKTTKLKWMMYKISLSCAEMLTNQSLGYLRKCGNPDCDWIFYDDSKNHSRKWCDNKCASLMKVRKYRSVKKADEN